MKLWNNFHAVIYRFNGDVENFFFSYYGLLCDNLLSGKIEDPKAERFSAFCDEPAFEPCLSAKF